MLRDLYHCFLVPWLCAGNFNEITKTHEEKRGKVKTL